MAARLLLLVSAYSPVLIIIGILRPSWPWTLVLATAGLLLGVAVFVVEALAKRRNQPTIAKLISCRESGDEVAGYLTTYILPFLTTSVPTVRLAVAYGFFALLLLAVWLPSSKVALNPWLFLGGQRVFVVDVSGTDELAVARGRPVAGEQVALHRLVRGLYYLEVR